MSHAVYAFPLSYAQQRLWFLDQLSPGNSAYNIPVAIPIETPIEVAVLQRCVDALIERHETLRTSFELVDGEPRQQVQEQRPVVVRLVDIEHTAAVDDREAAVQRLASEETRRPFDLRHDPLLRVTLVRVEPRRHVLLMTLHHIVADAWSIGVLWSELTTLYAAFAAGAASPLPPLPIQYADYAIWQRAWLTGEVRETQLAYWRQRLDDLPTLMLPTDRGRPTVQSFRGDHVPVTLDAALTGALARLGQHVSATLFMTVLAGFKALLMRYSGQTDVMVGTPIAGRDRAQLEGLIGFFVNTLVLRTDLSDDPTVLDLIARVRETALGAYAHAELPFEMLVEELHPQRDLSRNPLFQVTFQLFATSRGQDGAVKTPPVDVKRGTAPFDLSLSLWESSAGLHGVLEYSTDLYDRARMERLVGHLQTLLAGMVAQPEAPLSQLPVLTAAERRQLLVEWNATQADYPAQCLHDLVAAQAHRAPEAVAVVCGDEQLTYGALEWRANQVAHRLRAAGVGADTLVGLCVERSLQMVVGLLGILKAGGAYVPLDPQYPAERLRYMLTDAQVAVLLTEQALLPHLPASAVPRLRLDQDWAEFAAFPGDVPPPAVATPDHLAYVIYTSGSTGAPKGIAMPHRPLMNLIAWQQRQAEFLPRARAMQFAPLSFDVSFQEILSTLCSGGSLILVTDAARADPAELLSLLTRQRVRRLFLPPVALQQLAAYVLEHSCDVPPDLREVITAGEQLKATTALKALFERLPGCTLTNQYGPSETHVVTSQTLTGPPREWPALPPIRMACSTGAC